ncbi:MAG: type II secretion system F family protein [Actinobacteria bacterium]|nr:type II secretion system F family protein [Actinomycetota bacterium]
MTDEPRAEIPKGKTPKRAKYRYEGETIDGERVKGVVEGPSANHARNELAVQGIRVTKIAEKKGLQVEVTKQKVPLVDIMHFSRQMATFLRAGVPMTEALNNLRQDADNTRFKAVLADVLDRVTGGRSVTEALSMHADIFPSYFMALLGSAELTGRMDEAFDQLHAYVRRDVELTRSVRKALIYPCILLGISIAVVVIIVVFAIPKFAEFFKDFGATLPLPTRMLMAIADFVQSPAGMITGLVLVVGSILLVVYVRTPGGRRNLHGLQLRVPLIKTVVTYSSTERFTRVLAALLDAGVPLPDALPTSIDCANNLVYKERLAEAMEGTLAGAGFADPLASTELFPSAVIQMVRVGERTGELSDQLNNAASFYEEELTYAVDKLTAYFEPLMIVFIGVVVGFVALAMVAAMYGVYNQVQF